MKLAYIANVRMPTEKAHGAQIVHMCKAFVESGMDVSLIVPNRLNILSEDAFTYYGIAPLFPIVRTFTLDWVRFGKIGFLIESFVFALSSIRTVRTLSSDWLYGRDEMVLWILSLFVRTPMVWETHTGSWNWFAKRVTRSSRVVVVISEGLAEFYAERGVPRSKILVAHDGVDLSAFSTEATREEARERLGLPSDRPIALYIGRLDGWKGIDTFLQAAQLLPDVRMVVIGGEPEQVDSLRPRFPEVTFLGYRPYRDIASNQAAADVLVLPNTATDTVSAQYTSPLKLFTYMASGRPMILSDLPSLRAVVDESAAYYFKPDDPASLAETVRTALSDSHAPERAKKARLVVEAYTWQARAMRIRARIER